MEWAQNATVRSLFGAQEIATQTCVNNFETGEILCIRYTGGKPEINIAAETGNAYTGDRYTTIDTGNGNLIKQETVLSQELRYLGSKLQRQVWGFRPQ